MIKVEWFYGLCGIFFVLIALQVLNDRSNPKRLGSRRSGAFSGSRSATAPSW